MTEKPLPCPFCGNIPLSEGNEGASTPYETRHTAWHVHCVGERFRSTDKGLEECPVAPSVEEATEAEAVKAWNTRFGASDTDTAIPAGWKMVPIDPTEAMLEAGYAADQSISLPVPRHPHVWSAMLAAASPKPDTDTPVDSGVEGGAIEQLAHAAEICVLPSVAEWLRSVESIGEFDCVRLSVAVTALALATKPIAGMDAGEVEATPPSA